MSVLFYRTSQGFITHLYNEREVERAAWTKYGGPEGYEIQSVLPLVDVFLLNMVCVLSLETLRQHQTTRNPQKPFLTPSLRKKSGGRNTFGTSDTSYDDWGVGPTYTWKLDPLPAVLQAVKDRFPAGSEWLWNKCNEALDPMEPYSLDMELSERVKALSWAVERLSQGALTPYPPRPPESLPSSESVDKLRVILAAAPRVPAYGNEEDEIDGMVRCETWHPEWDVSYEWSKDYYNKVYQVLIDIVKQHGVGDQGWGSVRWEVYDTVSIYLVRRSC